MRLRPSERTPAAATSRTRGSPSSAAPEPRGGQPPAGFGTPDGPQRRDLGDGLGLAVGHLAYRALEDADAARERLDRLGDRVGKVNPIGVRTLEAAPVDAHRMARVADDRRVGRDVCDDDAVGADLRTVPIVIGPEQLRPRADRHVVLHGRMALAGRKAGASQSDALIEGHVVADLGGLADHDAPRRGR